MIDLTYTLPKQEDAGRRDGETVETSESHIFKDTTPEVVMNELRKLSAQGFDVKIKLTLKEPK